MQVLLITADLEALYVWLGHLGYIGVHTSFTLTDSNMYFTNGMETDRDKKDIYLIYSYDPWHIQYEIIFEKKVYSVQPLDKAKRRRGL